MKCLAYLIDEIRTHQDIHRRFEFFIGRSLIFVHLVKKSDTLITIHIKEIVSFL